MTRFNRRICAKWSQLFPQKTLNEQHILQWSLLLLHPWLSRTPFNQTHTLIVSDVIRNLLPHTKIQTHSKLLLIYFSIFFPSSTWPSNVLGFIKVPHLLGDRLQVCLKATPQFILKSEHTFFDFSHSILICTSVQYINACTHKSEHYVFPIKYIKPT